MKIITLRHGEKTVVDDDDFDRFCGVVWNAELASSNGKSYVMRKSFGKRIYLHRLIAGDPAGLMVDHINHDTLDNQKHNLRACTNAQNGRNRSGPAANSTSGVRGVYWNNNSHKWQASIGYNGRLIHLGLFSDKEDAIKARNLAVDNYFGEFCGL